MRTFGKWLLYGLAIVGGLWALAFVLVFACIADTSRPVEQCRDNVAGDMVATVLNVFIK